MFGKTVLKNMYFIFQLTLLQILTQELDPGKFTKVIERSIQSNRFCFIELAKQLGNITEQGIALGWPKLQLCGQYIAPEAFSASI